MVSKPVKLAVVVQMFSSMRQKTKSYSNKTQKSHGMLPNIYIIAL